MQDPSPKPHDLRGVRGFVGYHRLVLARQDSQSDYVHLPAASLQRKIAIVREFRVILGGGRNEDNTTPSL